MWSLGVWNTPPAIEGTWVSALLSWCRDIVHFPFPEKLNCCSVTHLGTEWVYVFNLVDLVKVSIPAMSSQQIQAASAKASLGPAVIVASIRMNVWFRSLLIEWCLIPFPVCKSPHRLYYTVVTSSTTLAKIKLLLILEGFHCWEKNYMVILTLLLVYRGFK